MKLTDSHRAILQTIARTGWAYDHNDKAGRCPHTKIGQLREAGLFQLVLVNGGTSHQLTVSGYAALGALAAP